MPSFMEENASQLLAHASQMTGDEELVRTAPVLLEEAKGRKLNSGLDSCDAPSALPSIQKFWKHLVFFSLYKRTTVLKQS